MKNSPLHKTSAWMWIGIPIIFLLACNVTVSTVEPSSPITPTAGSPAASPIALLSDQVTLIPVPLIESDPGSNYPPYTITAQTPQLTGSDDPRVLAFNQRLDALISAEVDTYRQQYRSLLITPLSNGSSLEVTYTTVSQIGDLWSLKFDFSFYADTAAHPGVNIVTFNYDLGQGNDLALDDLFLPDFAYLEAVAGYCLAELQKQPYADSSTVNGAQPTMENYRSWNLTEDGLQITFGVYQVAPGAAGPQTVVVPYDTLAEFINPQGPLAILGTLKGGN